MATIYLIDGHTNPIANSQINDVQFTDVNDQVPLTDNFPIRIGDQLSIDEPSSYSDLLAKKGLALLADFPGFATILFDDLTDATGISAANSTSFVSGSRQTVGLSGPGTGSDSRLQTVATALGSTPTQFVLVWEAFQVVYNEDPKTGRLTRSYQDGTDASIEAEVSFNNGSTFITGVQSGVMTDILVADQGSTGIIRLQDSSDSITTPTYFNSLALIY